MRLSIIIPAYNVELYLERCIDSCMKQDIPHEEYEVIVVNDGSTDNTLAVAQRLADNYNNMVVRTQKNGGSSAARNHGLREAKGDYIWFVDADDYIVENCIGRVLTISKEHDIDICHFSLHVFSPNGELKRPSRLSPINVVMRGRDILLKEPGTIICSACANFYKRSFFTKNKLRFVEGITQQDVEINGRAFALAERCIFVEDSMYMYFYNPESIRRSPKIEKRIKYASDTVRVLALRNDFYKSRCDDIELGTYFSRYANSCIASNIRSMVKENTDKLILNEFIETAKEKGLYPLKGLTLSRTWNMMLPIINQRKLWWIFRFV